MEKAERQGKPWYKSKTVWVNIIALCAIVASYFGFEIRDDEILVIATAIVTVVNIALRFVTKEPIVVHTKSKKQAQHIRTKEETIKGTAPKTLTTGDAVFGEDSKTQQKADTADNDVHTEKRKGTNTVARGSNKKVDEEENVVTPPYVVLSDVDELDDLI